MASVKTSVRWVVLAASAVTAMTGCTVLERPPAITVTSISVAEPSADAQRDAVSVVLELQNPNSIPLELEDVRYSVTGSDGSRYEGRRAALATIPPHGTSQLILPGVVAAGTGANAEAAGTVRYLAPGHLAEILFETGFRRPTVGFRSRR
jgi:LEA14-like dessication related protein